MAPGGNVTQNNNDLREKYEYGCHFVSKNPKFLASISYPNVSKELSDVFKVNTSEKNRESSIRLNKNKFKNATQRHPKRVCLCRKYLLLLSFTLIIPVNHI